MAEVRNYRSAIFSADDGKCLEVDVGITPTHPHVHFGVLEGDTRTSVLICRAHAWALRDFLVRVLPDQ
jgi:hypothetical protein